MAEETITEQTPEIDPGMSVMPEGPGLMDVPTVIPELGLAAQALASQVSFAKKTWKDGSGGGTPVTAAELNRLEQGVADLTAAVNRLRDSVSQYRTAWGKTLSFPITNSQTGILLINSTIVSAVLCSNKNISINEEARANVSASYSDGVATLTASVDTSMLVVIFRG